MKTLLMLFALSSLLISSAAIAQTSKREYKIAGPGSLVDPESKAVKNFKRSHPDVTNESWSTDNGYYFVKFKKGDVKNKIVYTPNGKNSTIKQGAGIMKRRWKVFISNTPTIMK